MVLAQYNYTIMYNSGERNCWNLLSRWVNVPAVTVWGVAVLTDSAPDKTMPSKDAIREVLQQARAGSSAMVSGASSFTTPVARATKDNGIFFAWGWMLETCFGSRTKRRNCRRAS